MSFDSDFAARSTVSWLYVPEAAWGLIVPVAALAAAVAFPIYSRDSYWLSAAIALGALVVVQSLIGAGRAPSIPGLIVVTALVQWVFAPWASYHVLPSFVLYRMVVTSQEYFGFAVPATLALAVGVYAPLAISGIGGRTRAETTQSFSPAMRRALRKTCDIMVVLGLLVSVMALAQLPEVVRYIGVLVADLACVGAFALCLLREDGWGWRVAAVLGEQFILASVDGVFHDMLLWLTYFLLILACRDRLRVRTLLVVGLCGLYGVAALSSIKLQYRRALEEMPSVSTSDRVEALGEAVGAQMLHPTRVFSDEEVRYGISRLNQGWIISRILTWVPTREPYAGGETIVNAIENAVTPRIFSPEKYRSGGYAYFARFTGVHMDRASMNLGLSGEMYANFGRSGAIAAIFVWGALLGWLLVQLARAAQRSWLWWAWAPYVMLYTVQAETGIGEVVNQVSKSMLVMLVVITLVPAWRSLRFWRLPDSLDRRLQAASP
jgi:hypothetical protein